MLNFYIFFALLFGIASYIAYYEENKKVHLLLDQLLKVIVEAIFWPIVLGFILYDFYKVHKKNKQSKEEPVSNLCGCGCGKVAEKESKE